MSGYLNDDKSLANGIPDRSIGPETGSSGNATMTNKAGTSQGTNESADSRPAPAAGLGDSALEGGEREEEARSFARSRAQSEPGYEPDRLDTDVESAAQHIADGDDRVKHDHD